MQTHTLNTERARWIVRCGSQSTDVHTTSPAILSVVSHPVKHYPISLKIEVLPRPMF